MSDSPDHVFHRAPDRPVAVRGSGSTIVDRRRAHRFLDGAGGAIASSIGHGRAEVVAAMAAQAGLLEYVHSTQFTTEAVARFAAHVAEVVPMRDARVFPVSGGSEANETALKLARAYHLAHGETERHIVLARLGAYHGNTRGVLDASNRASVTVGYEPWLGQTVRVPLANPYRDAAQRGGARGRDRPHHPGHRARTGGGLHRRTGERRDARRRRAARRLLAGGGRRAQRRTACC